MLVHHWAKSCTCDVPSQTSHTSEALWDSHVRSGHASKRNLLPQNWFFSAATANAFTTVFAGFAFTIVTFPNISRLPALVAGLTRVLTRQTPGSENTEFFFSSVAATPARASMTFAAWDFLSSQVPARDSARAPFVIAFPFMAFGAIAAIGRKTKNPRA